MPKFSEKQLKSENYPVNNSTLLAFLGLCFFGFLGIIFMLNAVARLFASVWMYSFEGRSLAAAGMTFVFATVCFVTAVLCRKGFMHCLSQLRKLKLSN